MIISIRKTLCLLLLFILNFQNNLFGQFSSYSKKDKFGIVYNSEKITPCKYDSVIFQDDFIATAYNKKKAFYLDTAGSLMLKSSASSWPFKNGMGVVSNKKEEYAIVGRQGDFLMDFHECLEVKRFDNLIQYTTITHYKGKYTSFDSYSHYLITKNGALPNLKKNGYASSVDTFYLYNNFIQLCNDGNYDCFLYNSETLNLIDENQYKMEISDTLGVSLIKKSNNTYSIYKPKEELVQKDIKELTFFDSAHFYGQQNEESIFFQIDSLKPLFTSNFMDVIKHKDVYRVYHDKRAFNKELPTGLISHYSLTGEHLIGPTFVTHEFDDGRYIFHQSGKSFIGQIDGTRLSDSYDFIDPASHNNLHLVTFNHHNQYGFINDSTYAPLPFSRQLVYRKIGPKKDDGQGFFRGLVMVFNMITLPVSAFVVPEAWEYALDVGYDPNKLILSEPGSFFEDGYMPVFVTDSTPKNTVIILEHDEEVCCNYAGPSGELLNQEKYIKCLPFSHGKAWVKNKKGFVLIDNNNNIIKKRYQYDDINLYKGYYITEYSYMAQMYTFFGLIKVDGKKERVTEYGLISPDHKTLKKCHYSYGEITDLVDKYTASGD